MKSWPKLCPARAAICSTAWQDVGAICSTASCAAGQPLRRSEHNKASKQKEWSFMEFLGPALGRGGSFGFDFFKPHEPVRPSVFLLAKGHVYCPVASHSMLFVIRG